MSVHVLSSLRVARVRYVQAALSGVVGTAAMMLYSQSNKLVDFNFIAANAPSQKFGPTLVNSSDHLDSSREGGQEQINTLALS